MKRLLIISILCFPMALLAQDAKKVLQLIKTKEYVAAQQITDQLLRQATSISQAVTLKDLAAAFHEQFRYAEAEPLYKRALELHEEKLKDDPSTTELLNTMGWFYEDQGRYSEAKTFHQRALEIRNNQQPKDDYAIVQSLNSLGVICKELGHYFEAEVHYIRALEIGGDDFVIAVIQNNQGLLYQEQNRHDEAEKLYKQALETQTNRIRRGEGTDADKVPPLHNLARLYWQQGHFAQAEPLQKEALAIDEKTHGTESPEAALSMNTLAMIYFGQERVTDAERLLRQAVDIYENRAGKEHYWTAEGQNDLAELYLSQQRYTDAEPLLNQSIATFEKGTMAPHYGQKWYRNRATLYKSTNRPTEAIADLKRAMDLSVDVRRNTSGNDENRAHTFSQYYNLFEKMVDWQHELGDINEAYIAMERSRAQGLQDLMNAASIDLLANVPEDKAQKLRADENAALAEIASLERLAAIDNKPNEALKNALQRHANARAAIRSASPAYRTMLAEDRKPIDFETIQQALSSEKALALQYLIGTEKSYLLFYGLDTKPILLPLQLNEEQAALFGIEVGSLTAKKLETLLQNEDDNGVLQLIGSIFTEEREPKLKKDRVAENGMPSAKTLEKLSGLWSVLVPDEQIRAKLTDRRTFAKLLILPDGALTRFPFEALVVELNDANPRYLLDLGLATVYAPSASMYYNLKMLKTESDKPKVLTVGNPDYDLNRNVLVNNTESRKQSQHSRGFYLSALPGTAEETAKIESSCHEYKIPVARFDGKESTEANIRQNVEGQKIVHLACHGLASANAGDALFSWLALTNVQPNNPKDNGVLDLAEMFALNLKSCELAVLSACQTNLGPNQHGEGTWSMGRGMLASGAKRVVTTNWSVDDESSSWLVYWFVHELNASISESSKSDHAAALRQAKREIRSGIHPEGGREVPEWRHPYYWAPFVLMGPN